ncbi:MAG: lysylphosphatidylglycerol synthase domain-containing protein [Bacteroidota bacterium]|nr:lysylphosphatidylglycerol synthase domain-containing protein [Bacteroidota bacterium]
MRDRAKITKTANIILRVIIFIITYGFIFHEVFLHRAWEGVSGSLLNLFSNPWLVAELMGILFLMAVNWGTEAMKWRFMIGKIEKVSFLKSCQAVLTGVSISSFMPNRTGEFFGRVFILEKGSHMEGILITILGSMSQLLITILAGSLAILFFLPDNFPSFPGSSGFLYTGIVIITLTFDLILILLFFNVSLLSFVKGKWLKGKIFSKTRRFFDVFSYYNFKELATVLMLSLFRYGVFSCQFFLLLKIFHVPVPVADGLILIPMIFFILTVVPSSIMTDLGIRGSAALYIFGLFFTRYGIQADAMNLGVLTASTLIWVINLLIPAILGTFFLFRLKFFRKEPVVIVNA